MINSAKEIPSRANLSTMSKYNPFLRTVDKFRRDTTLKDLFRFNELTEDIEFIRSPEFDGRISAGKVLDDQDIIALRYYITSVHGFEPPQTIVGDACFIVAKDNSYHPIKKYIEGIKWNGVARCDEWLIKAVNADDNIYTRMASSKFLIASVNRIYNPGCKFDHMMILEGDQGIGKSTLVEIMANPWYLDTNFDNRDKDLVDSMRGVLWVEISELTGMNKKDIDWLKSFLSKKVDRVRLPYASRSKDFHRKCVFIGTYNPSGNNMYLRDDTGNRRFWPIECNGRVDFGYLKENRDQLWAEAYMRYKNGEEYYIKNPVALDILSNLHGERELESPTYIRVRSWLNTYPHGGIVSMMDIIEKGLKIYADGKNPKELLSVQTTIGIIMRRMKWRKGTNDNRDKYYMPGVDHIVKLEQPTQTSQPQQQEQPKNEEQLPSTPHPIEHEKGLYDITF